MIKINQANLEALRGRAAVFTYDRQSSEPSVLHFGVGRFHRAHQAVVFDKLLETRSDCGIFGVNLIPDPEFESHFKTQDCLYSVTEIDMHNHSTRVVGSIFNFANITDGLPTVPWSNFRMITCTLTQAGYYFDHQSGSLDFSALPQWNIYRALSWIAEYTKDVCYVVSCDNIPQNSQLLKSGFKDYLDKFEPDKTQRKLERFVFLTSVVDRVTPASDEKLIQKFLTPVGISDSCPVFCESYFDWIIQKHEGFPFPELAEFGVKFVDNVSFYERLKLKILNLTHFVIGLLGVCDGVEFVHEVLNTDEYKIFLERIIFYEVIPGSDLLNNQEAFEYAYKTLLRFSNHALPDQCARLTRNSVLKIKNLILSTVRDCVSRELRCEGLLTALALWIHLIEANKIQVNHNDVTSILKDETYTLVSSRVDQLRKSFDHKTLKNVLLSCG